MQWESVQQHLPRAWLLIYGLGNLGCFLISSPQLGHPEPHGQTQSPARLNAIHMKKRGRREE